MYLDLLDNPVAVGDIIAYPAASGSSAAQMHQAVITELIPIYPNAPGLFRGRTRTGTKLDNIDRPLFSRHTDAYTETTRRDYQTGIDKIVRNYEREPDPARAYILRVKRYDQSSLPNHYQKPRPGVIVRNVDRIIVITSLVSK